MLSKTIKFRGQTYTIPMPKTGQILQIETMKTAFSLNNYGSLMDMKTKHSSFALDIIDAMSYFSVLCEPIRKQITADNWEELEMKFAQELVRAVKTWHDWYEAEVVKIRKEVEEANKDLIDIKDKEQDVDSKS